MPFQNILTALFLFLSENARRPELGTFVSFDKRVQFPFRADGWDGKGCGGLEEGRAGEGSYVNSHD